MTKPRKTRLDHLMVERGLTLSRTQAQRLIMSHQVSVDGSTTTKPGTLVSSDAAIEIGERPAYVSRGGLKLAEALDAFGVRVKERTAADVGASTGGFTDCLLQRGARRVYAIDVGYGQLAWSLRQDSRVVVMERTNARHLSALPEPVQLATIDVSFISLTLILPRVRDWLTPGGEAIALIKPQFEAGRRQVGKGGVVREPAVHRQVLQKMLSWAPENGLHPGGLIRSPITGPAGNAEFLIWLTRSEGPACFDFQDTLDAALVSTPGHEQRPPDRAPDD